MSVLDLCCILCYIHRIYDAAFKMEVYLRIAKLYLEEADHVSAEAYINRAGMLQSDVDRSDLHIIYKVRHACIYDEAQFISLSLSLSLTHTHTHTM